MLFQGAGSELTDREVWEVDLRLADLAEPLGFDSIWTVEHHFTNYTMCPDPLQFLTYMAGRTERVQLGTMVLVLPWHHPVRVAEQITLLDHVSKGRVILGLGRGTGRVEFDGFGVDMATTRPYFKELAQTLLGGLENGVIEFDGEFVHQPRVELRPGPYKSFKGRTYSGTVSPESAEIMAKMGTGVLVVPQKPWGALRTETETYRQTFRESVGEEAPPSVMAGWVVVHENPDMVEELARKHLSVYWKTCVDHYEMDQPHLRTIPGYEFVGEMYERLIAPGGLEKMADAYMALQPWGTPEQVVEKITAVSELVHAESFIGVFRYGGMSPEEGERNMRLFADEVLPELKTLGEPRSLIA